MYEVCVDRNSNTTAIAATAETKSPLTAAVRGSSSQSVMAEVARTIAAALLAVVVSIATMAFVSHFGRTWWMDDFKSQYLPAYMDMARAMREGSFPLLSTGSWFGGDFAGEYQYGIFSIVHLAIVFGAFQLNLGLQDTATVLIVVYQAILAAGSFRLARRLGLATPNAMVACLAATLNGYLLFWGSWDWFNTLSSFAWLPWAWWAMLLSLDSRYGLRRLLPASVMLYLLLAAGQPFTVLMAALVTALILIRNWQPLRGRVWPLPVAWGLGLALAAPAILGLLEYHSFTTRSSRWALIDPKWAVPPSAFGGLLHPQMPAKWDNFAGYFPTDAGQGGFRNSCELFGGLVPCMALLAALLKWRRRFADEYRWELLFLSLLAFLCCCGAVGAFRFAFRWLPLFHLQLGLLGGFALQCFDSHTDDAVGRERFTSPGWWAAVCMATVFLFGCITSAMQPGVYFIGIGLTLLGLSVLWWLGDAWLPKSSASRCWLPVGIMAMALMVGNLRPGDPVPHWSIGETIRGVGPFDKNRTYLALMSLRDVQTDGEGMGEINRFGNTAMYAGLSFVNGYSPMLPRQMAKSLNMEWIGQQAKRENLRVVDDAAKPLGLLDQMGVDGLVLGCDFMKYADRMRQFGWELVGRFPMGIVFHRPGRPEARIRSLTSVVADDSAKTPQSVLAKADIADVDEARLSVRCHVKNMSETNDALVAFSRAYYPGYRAYLNGVEVPVEAIAGLQLGARIAPNSDGELLLVFSPESVHWGIAIAAAASLITAAFFVTRTILDRRSVRGSVGAADVKGS